MTEELENQGVEIDEDPEGKVTVTLQMDAGEVSMRVPREAVRRAAKTASTTSLTADEFLGAIVDDAFAEHDTDGNATLEWEEFVEYARRCAFLTAWFGDLSSSSPGGGGAGGATISWQDAHLA